MRRIGLMNPIGRINRPHLARLIASNLRVSPDQSPRLCSIIDAIDSISDSRQPGARTAIVS